ncbi:hypothetical protein Clacol_001943 [Clathrus columnatus]|uniref:Uncharacterized protein n=1 Tax=Clathrus columnatus TaxID=1419009 RepID=A0AAV5A4Z3_9AGAM|nr:hypothetical protein Clacol_001943 [Clathrus columnatus]
MARRKSQNISTPSSISTRSSTRFSASKSGTSTPATSLADDSPKLVPEKKGVKTLTRASTKRSREQNFESDQNDDSQDENPAKKRVLTRSAFVELPRKVFSSTEAQSSKTKSENKLSVSSPGSEVELLSEDDGLDFQEDSSGSSGSEFQLSDEDLGAYQGTDDEDEAEASMMSAAIQMSLQTSVLNLDSHAASSSRSSASTLRAAAAERRRRANNAPVYDELSELSEDNSEEEPLLHDFKGKGKAKGRGNKITKRTRAQLQEDALMARQDKQALRIEQMALRRKLGRPLTHAERTALALNRHHPELKNVWGDLKDNIPITVPIKDSQPEGLKLSLLPFQLESLYWMKKQEKSIWFGGLLADEMGMGKTIQMIALLVSDRQKPNLIVAPTVAVMQWKGEIETHTEDFKVVVWHGASREQNSKELEKYDVVLTTYAVLESCFRKQQSGFKRKDKIVKEKSLLHSIEWKRIILDEAHNIKERSTNTAKATFELNSEYKWCLSGTPLQNRVGELYSIIRFLGGDPFSYYFCKSCECKSLHWKFSDKRTCDDCGHSPMMHAMEGPGRIAFKKLKVLLDRMMLRRTKIERADDLGLPPRTIIIRRDHFSEEERELTYVDSGTLLNNYSNIFTLITRMRQMACHPDLVLKSKQNFGKLSENLAEAPVCRLCHDIAEDAIRSRCRHLFDRECIRQYLSTLDEGTPACPVCHLPISVDLDAPALEFDEEARIVGGRQGILGRLDLDTWRSSTKIETLIEELTNLRRQDANTKSIVFSQFVNFLDLIAFRLQRAGFNICRLEGTMSPQARDATIKHFMNNVHVTVFLVSLKAGGVALNLTEVESGQAMDRIHRLGQHRPVEAIKLVIEDSIESRIIQASRSHSFDEPLCLTYILQLQEKKKAMIDATLSADDSAMGRLTPEDVGYLFCVVGKFSRVLKE